MSEDNKKRYSDAAHAMQSGVKMMMNYEHPEAQTPDNALDPSTSPKHLRVGINSTMVDHAALMHILLNKKIITLDDYFASLADEMEEEVERYEKAIEEAMFEKTGNRTKVSLH